jgi:hypothetical protein
MQSLRVSSRRRSGALTHRFRKIGGTLEPALIGNVHHP